MITQINAFAQSWFSYFGLLTIQNTLFLCVIFLAFYFLKNASASLRYSIALLGMVKLLLPAFIPYFSAASPASASLLSVDYPISQGVSAVNNTVHLSFLGIILLLWLAGCIIYLLWSIISTLKLKYKLSQAIFLSTFTIDGKRFSICQNSRITVPMSMGISPSRIYVPKNWDTLNDDLKRSLLMHEVAHIERKDGLIQILQTVIQAIYLFNPLVWILNKYMNDYREMACDDMAISAYQTEPLSYSRYLVTAAENMIPVCNSYSMNALFKQKHSLYHRINYQIKEKTMLPKKKNSKMIWALLLICIVPFSWYCSNDAPEANIKNGDQNKFYGTVLDENTGNPIAGANIIINNTALGASSNEKGEFVVLNVPNGEYSVNCRVIGYTSADMKMTFKGNRPASFKAEFKLKAAAINSETVTVTAPRPASAPDKPVKFIPYDTPPKPIGGQNAIAQNIVYPKSASESGIEGTVVIQCFVDKNGIPSDMNILRGLPNTGLDEAATNAIKKVRFEPALQRDKKVGVWISIPVQFKLD